MNPVDVDFGPVVLRLHLGRPHTCRGNGHRYAPLFVAYHGRTDTEFVAYVALDGPDRGKHFVCELSDWALRFALIVGAPQGEPVWDMVRALSPEES